MAGAGRPAVHPTVVDAVQRRLRSQTIAQAARDCGLSRRTIHRIADGSHTNIEPSANLCRCQSCGGLLVIVPCQACLHAKKVA